MTPEQIVQAAVEAFETEVKKYPRRQLPYADGASVSWGLRVPDAMRVVIDAVAPLIEADLLDRTAQVWDQSPDTVWRGGYVAERTRRWRDNLAELARLSGNGELHARLAWDDESREHARAGCRCDLSQDHFDDGEVRP